MTGFRYDSKQASDLIQDIQKQIEELEAIYNSLVSTWDEVVGQFTLESDTLEKLRNVVVGEEGYTGKTEFKRIVENYKNVASNIQTINADYKQMATNITDAINNYTSRTTTQ